MSTVTFRQSDTGEGIAYATQVVVNQGIEAVSSSLQVDSKHSERHAAFMALVVEERAIRGVIARNAPPESQREEISRRIALLWRRLILRNALCRVLSKTSGASLRDLLKVILRHPASLTIEKIRFESRPQSLTTRLITDKALLGIRRLHLEEDRDREIIGIKRASAMCRWTRAQRIGTRSSAFVTHHPDPPEIALEERRPLSLLGKVAGAVFPDLDEWV